MEERRILSNQRHNSGDVPRVTFSTIRKNGLDPAEVRSYLDSVSREMNQLEHRIRDLHEQLADAQKRAANPVFDEATLTQALGAQSAAILRSAHEEAGRVTAEAQQRGAAVFSEAQHRASAQLIETQERITVMLTEAEQSAHQLDVDARNGAERLIETAKINGESLVERSREQGRAIVEQATEARRAILNDLAIKRKALTLQIEQLRVARDTLITSVQGVRDDVDDLLSTLASSDEVARQAAIEALRLRPSVPEPSEAEIAAAAPLREVPEPVLTPLPKASSVRILPPEAATAPTPVVATPASKGDVTPAPVPVDEVEVDTGTDVVSDIFARLREATLVERGATAAAPKKPAAPKADAPNGELFLRRDAAIEEVLSVLTRKVKRALQDDQNIVLERLRDAAVTELEDELSQRARYAEAARETLGDVASAGTVFAAAETGVTAGTVNPAAIDECAVDLAVTIVVALRKRIMADGNGDASERANAAYKEWRGARVERLCTDVARRAFHVGVTQSAVGRHVQFLVAPNDAPCDACALDAAAPPRAYGQAFPSGSLFPPLHAGCACTVLPH
jgi:cell division septum initiation protein DivIVA